MSMSPSATKNQFNATTSIVNNSKPGETMGELGKSKVQIKGMTLLRKDSLEEEKEKLGRYWIW